jgi:hypothetical protein
VRLTIFEVFNLSFGVKQGYHAQQLTAQLWKTCLIVIIVESMIWIYSKYGLNSKFCNLNSKLPSDKSWTKTLWEAASWTALYKRESEMKTTLHVQR